MGCRIGAKRSTLATYLEDAAGAGARVVVGADARVIETVSGRVTGLTADVGPHTLRVRARTVVVGVNTPALLLRRGLGGPAAGRYPRVHPGPRYGGVSKKGRSVDGQAAEEV